MPKKDSCHDSVVQALRKQRWQILDEFAKVRASDLYIEVDIEAQHPDKHAYIEVKGFPRQNKTQELYIAFGQYLIYRSVLASEQPGKLFYLAVPIAAYRELFTESVRQTVQDNHVKMIVIDEEMEAIVQWIE